MPGSIKISDIQPPVTTPLFLHVAVGKREYSGNIGQDGFSFPVTSLRDSMVMTLHGADKDLVSKTEVNTKAIVELGTMDVVFSPDSGGTIILQLRFLLSDEDRKRVQEMRNSAVKRKQQELLGNGYVLRFQDSPLPKERTEDFSDIQSKGDQLMFQKNVSVDDASSVVSVALSKEQTEKSSNIPSKGDQLTLRKSLSLDGLNERVVSAIPSADSGVVSSKYLPLQSGGNTSKLESPIDSKKCHDKPKGKSISAVKKMISAFESSSPQAPHSIPRIKSESSLEGVSLSSESSSSSSINPPTPGASLSTQTDLVARTSGKVTITSADTGPSSRPGKQVMLGNKKPNTSRQTGMLNTSESRRRSSGRRDRTAKTSMGDSDSIRSEKRSAKKHRRHSVGAYLLEKQLTSNPWTAGSSITWIHPHICITTASRQLKDLVDLEHLNATKVLAQNTRADIDKRNSGDDMRDAAVSARQSPVLNGWLINQGVRVVIVIIACGAVFLNNR